MSVIEINSNMGSFVDLPVNSQNTDSSYGVTIVENDSPTRNRSNTIIKKKIHLSADLDG